MLTLENLSYCKSQYTKYHNDGRVAKVGFIFTDDTYWESLNTACHAGLYGIKYNIECPKKDIKGVWSVYKTPHKDLTKNDQERFVDWMVNKSPYSSTFLLKDVDTIINSCWISNPDVDGNLMVAGSIATRFLSEDYYKGNSKTWAELVNNGADPTYAYVLAQQFKASKNIYPIRKGSGDLHTGVKFSNYSLSLSYNFIKNKIVKNSQSYQELKSYSGLTDIFKENGKEDFESWTTKVRPIKNSMHMSYNIFSQNKKETNVLADKEDLMSVYDQFVKEIG